MTKIRILHSYSDDSDPVVLGQVETDQNEEWASNAIPKAFQAFQKTHPDTDSEFIDYLVEHLGFTKVPDEFIDITV